MDSDYRHSLLQQTLLHAALSAEAHDPALPSRRRDVLLCAAQFFQYVLPGCDALGYTACTGTNFCVRAQALAKVRMPHCGQPGQDGSMHPYGCLNMYCTGCHGLWPAVQAQKHVKGCFTERHCIAGVC
mgnify:CR=1 FL=1